MKRVIMVAYRFPPDGSAGVFRPLRFVRHLQGFDWHPTVLAAENTQGRYDPGLLSLVPDNIEIVRVKGEDFWLRLQAWRAGRGSNHSSGARLEKLGSNHVTPASSLRTFFREGVRRCEAWFYHPDMARPWIKPAVKAAIQVCRQINPKVIWVTGGPWSAFVVARKVRFQTGVPYILDFRDSWTLAGSPFYDLRPEWAKRWDQRLLYELFQDAQAVVFRYHSEAESYWRAYPGSLDASRIHIIPNGFDGTIEEYKPSVGKQDKCMVLYAGTITPYRYDTLLQGLHLLKQSNPKLANKLQLLFVGEGMDVLAHAAEKAKVSDIVETKPPVSYTQVCGLQEKASALLLLGLLPMKGYELCGSKVFSYLKAGRPIIGIVPQDEMTTVLNRVGVNTIANIDRPNEISDVFRRLIEAWQNKTLSTFVPDPKSCEVYSAEQQTRALTRALEGAPPIEPFMPGSVRIPPSLQKEIGEEGWVKSVNKCTPS